MMSCENNYAVEGADGMEYKRNNKNEIILKLFIAGIIILMLMRDIAHISINKYIYVIYSASLMCLADYQTLVYMLSFLFPLVWGLPGTYIMLCATILLIIKTTILNKKAILLMLLFAIMELLASFWYPDVDFVEMAGYLFSVFVFFILLYFKEKIDCMKCVKLFFYGVAILCLIVVISGLLKAPSDWRYLFSKGWFRFGETQVNNSGSMMTSVNANTLAYYSITGICCGLVLLKREKGINKIIIIIIITYFVISGFLSVSRSWLLVASICVILFILSETRSFRGILSVSVIAIIGVLTIVYFLKNNPELLQGILRRLNDSGMSTAGGRVELFSLYLKAFLKSPRFFIIGTGVTQYKEVTHIFDSVHNGLEQILICYGLTGSIVFIKGMLYPVWKIRNTIKPLIYWMPFVGVALFTQTIQFVNPDALMFPYIIAVFALKAGGEESE